MKRFTGLFILLVLLCCSFPASADGVSQWEVVPGKNIGPVALDMSPSQVSQFGEMGETIGGNKNPVFAYYNKEDFLVYYSAGKAILISVYNPQVLMGGKRLPVKTSGGVQVGMSWGEVVARLGQPSVSRGLKVAKSQLPETYYSYDSGLGFRVQGSVVVQIDVWSGR